MKAMDSAQRLYHLMNDFEAVLQLNGSTAKCSFMRMVNAGELKYIVRVTAADMSYGFELRQQHLGSWALVTPCPDWLYGHEKELSETINRYSFKRINGQV